MPRARKNIDSAAVRELGLYIENDSELYHRQQTPIEKNLRLKGMKGKYDPKKAPKLWGYLVESGAKKYAKEFGGGQPWNKMFPKPTRDELARQAARAFENEHPSLRALATSKAGGELKAKHIIGVAKSRATGK